MKQLFVVDEIGRYLQYRMIIHDYYLYEGLTTFINFCIFYLSGRLCTRLYFSFSKMFSCFFILSLAFHVTLSLDPTDVDDVVSYCQNKINIFEAAEEKYVRKTKVRPDEPSSAYVPPVKELQSTVDAIHQNQRVFECIRNRLNGNFKHLDTSNGYRTLVEKCKLENQSNLQCDRLYPYRTIDGTCNNILHPRWGSTLSCIRRLFPANYEGASGIRKTFRGKQRLPEPRDISLKLVKPKSFPTKKYTSLFTFFGQVIAHDTAEFIFTTARGYEMLDCCSNRSNLHPDCIPMLNPPDDPFYSLQNISCFTAVRIVPCDSCSINKRRQLNQVSSYIDGSLLYDITYERAQKLRRNDGSGKLISQEYGQCNELLPPNATRGSTCGDGEKQHYCFIAGDDRANQHSILMMFQTLLQREHNRLADELIRLNPHWDDEKLYQEARKILIAELQVIVYKEYLPVLIGEEVMSQYGLIIGSGSFYNCTIDPSISDEFNAAAFRVHNMLPDKIFNDDEDYEYLKTLFSNAEPLYDDRMSAYLGKLSNYAGETYDWFMPIDLTQYLYRSRIGTYGFDLASIDIMRGRDVGLPTYPQVIEYKEKRIGSITSFEDLNEYIQPECKTQLQAIYSDVRDIDLWVGLACERIPDNMIISPTAADIIAEQFQRLKYGDRFYVEHDKTFNYAQRQTLLDASVSKLMCDNSKMNSIQPMSFLYPSAKNRPQRCSDIPGVNLDKWKE